MTNKDCVFKHGRHGYVAIHKACHMWFGWTYAIYLTQNGDMPYAWLHWDKRNGWHTYDGAIKGACISDVRRLFRKIGFSPELSSPVTEDEKVCEACGFINPIGGLREYGWSRDAHKDKDQQRKKNLCDFCASTYVGHVPEGVSENPLLMVVVGYGVNTILKAINDGK